MKELLSLGIVVDLENNKTDQKERAVKIYSLILLGRKPENLLRRLKDWVRSIHIVQQIDLKNVGIKSLKSA